MKWTGSKPSFCRGRVFCKSSIGRYHSMTSKWMFDVCFLFYLDVLRIHNELFQIYDLAANELASQLAYMSPLHCKAEVRVRCLFCSYSCHHQQTKLQGEEIQGFLVVYNILQCVVLLFQGFSNLFRNAACCELDCYHGIDPNALGSTLISHTNKFSAARLSPF